MIYTSAAYANAEHTLVQGTDADGNTETVPVDFTLFRQPNHGPQGYLANGGVIADYVEPQTPATYRLYKSTLIRRLTEDEAVVLTAVLDNAPVKSRMLWDASEWLDNSDPLFSDLEAAISGALGEERTAEILERE